MLKTPKNCFNPSGMSRGRVDDTSTTYEIQRRKSTKPMPDKKTSRAFPVSIYRQTQKQKATPGLIAQQLHKAILQGTTQSKQHEPIERKQQAANVQGRYPLPGTEAVQ